MNTDKEVRYDPQTGERIITERYVEPGVERIVKQPVIIKKKPGFGVWLGGAIVGAALLAGGYAYFAHERGSYSAAGAAVDQRVAQAESAVNAAAEDAGDVAKDTGDRIESATDRAANTTP
ncbi:MAG: hypothetical protein AB7M12_02825 [Hyphomonadaceae bacterium]